MPLKIRPNSLALYKNRPAIIRQASDKLEIELEGNKQVKVRPKDITLLHPGPIHRLNELAAQTGEVETAWELLLGSVTTLPELAELIYESYTPATAWATWQLIDDGLYFRGMPDEITVASPEEVNSEKAARQAKVEEERAWAAFIDHVQNNRITPEDERYLKEVEMLALGRNTRSRVLRELGHSESQENAHRLLLDLNYWDYSVDPYPQRLGAPVASPAVDLPELPAEERQDLTHLPAFAIDDEGSQDPDDALSLAEGWLWVHVADVAALAPPDSPADLEARARGANLYLPENTVHMLPEKATEILGLGLNEISPALSFGLSLGAEGEIKELEIVPSWVRVQRLSYEQVEQRLDEAPFDQLFRFAQAFQARRRANGGVFIELPEVKIRVENSQVIIRPLLPLKSRDLVREAMLAAGEAIARFALAQGIALPFTTQDPPEEEQDYPDTMAGMFARRRTLKRGQLTTVPGPHAGLGLDIYTRATSPLRRYSDLVVHQQVRSYLKGENPLDDQEMLARIGAAEAVAGSVSQAERLVRRHWTLVYLLNNPDWSGEAVLVDRRGSRSILIIPELELETQMYIKADLPLDSIILLKLTQVDLPQLEAHFQMQGHRTPSFL